MADEQRNRTHPRAPLGGMFLSFGSASLMAKRDYYEILEVTRTATERR